MSDRYTIRPFETLAEYQQCVALQEETWGQGFSERVAPAILKVSQILGGVAAGAYDEEGSLDGFVFGMTGVRGGEVVHWSDMLAVRRGLRDAGLGRRLKAYQRDQVMALGIRLMFWTFDPLQSRNAYLNFNKLGIVVRDYVEDMYGQTDSPLHEGIGTDRFIARWELDSQRVEDRLAGTGVESVVLDEIPVALTARRAGAHPDPGEIDMALGNELVAVEIPSNVVSLMNDDPALARAWRDATRQALTSFMAEGYEVREFLRGADASTYVLARGRE